MSKYRLVRRNWFTEDCCGVRIPVTCNIGIFETAADAAERAASSCGGDPSSIEQNDFEIQEIDE